MTGVNQQSKTKKVNAPANGSHGQNQNELLTPYEMPVMIYTENGRFTHPGDMSDRHFREFREERTDCFACGRKTNCLVEHFYYEPPSEGDNGGWSSGRLMLCEMYCLNCFIDQKLLDWEEEVHAEADAITDTKKKLIAAKSPKRARDKKQASK